MNLTTFNIVKAAINEYIIKQICNKRSTSNQSTVTCLPVHVDTLTRGTSVCGLDAVELLVVVGAGDVGTVVRRLVTR